MIAEAFNGGSATVTGALLNINNTGHWKILEDGGS